MSDKDYCVVNAPAENVLSDVVSLPASKSISNRVLILNSLSKSRSELTNIAKCDDTDVMVSSLFSDSDSFDIGAAGTAMRFLTAYLANKEGNWYITGSKRMKERPIKLLVDALNSLGADVSYAEKDGFPPLNISGRNLVGGEIELDGGVSSQYISALLMIAPMMKHGLKLSLKGNVISLPYIKMTLMLMEEFGVKHAWSGNCINIAPQEYSCVDFVVESDWSASSYWFEIAALSDNATFTLKGLKDNSSQGDSVVREIFERLGVVSAFTSSGLLVTKSSEAIDRENVFEYDFVNCPDLAQTVVCACCALDVKFRFIGLQSLKIKETDRINALIVELRRLGYVIAETCNGCLEYSGVRCEKEEYPAIFTYSDHRMAMAFAPMSLKCGSIKIYAPEVVSKSYPDFWKSISGIGFEII